MSEKEYQSSLKRINTLVWMYIASNLAAMIIILTHHA